MVEAEHDQLLGHRKGSCPFQYPRLRFQGTLEDRAITFLPRAGRPLDCAGTLSFASRSVFVVEHVRFTGSGNWEPFSIHIPRQPSCCFFQSLLLGFWG